mmetsp:Transcript_10338/g.17974  ORF Transcript_10338/g.17974 Transcript_10338/m.17974 type:complete len:111 (-) Transcript_10338:502-834(-)|eukprot:CAMPEP_0119102814 /NCGR_PEP_ID=MMETSP1180-20130426/1430_1 /TAXON_ID=3052 ORGANISM="Chlamydomonas cf sp, Strain CCMP681" /NCGR_SAMPLE_ID=MMETSP1180 /ASSEMBLY_ACC=CAM_ASM_000741 /LENGTH=110 /DNA_ID=CAMNT_0007087169 /DNA_START=145 /DNA_END=477 /DNA_ORIENTATION=+
MAFQQDIKSSDAFRREVLDQPNICQVVEVYGSWCGPCKAIVSVFKRIYFDAGDRPLKFFTVSQDVPEMAEYKGHCQPLFLFYKDGQVVDKVTGVVSSVLEQKIAEYSAIV